MPATDNFIKVRNAEGGVHRLAAADLPTGGGTYTDEQVRDVIGAALVAGANVTITVNDAGDTITIAATSSGGTNYWYMLGTALRINPTTTTGIKEWYAFLPGETTYLYLSDYGAGSRLVQLVGLEDMEITAGDTMHIHAANDLLLSTAGAVIRLDKAIVGESYVAASVTGATTVIPSGVSGHSVHKLTMTGNITLSVTNPATSTIAYGLTLYLVQDATGSRLVTWPSSFKWPGSIVPVLSTVGNSVDVVVAETFDAGTTWYANLAGKDYR